jgi:hypothetical protein
MMIVDQITNHKEAEEIESVTEYFIIENRAKFLVTNAIK